MITHMLRPFATMNIPKPLPLFTQLKHPFSSLTPHTTPPLSQKTTHTITEPLIHQFSTLTGDTNPIHINKQFAQKSIFRQQISHGMLPMGWLGEVLNQNGYQIKSMEIRFMKPIYIGDKVIVEVKVNEGGDDIKCKQFSAQIRKQYMQRNGQQSKQDKSQQHIIVTSITGSVQLLTPN